MKHFLNRTSPKGQPFVGTCPACGTEKLTLEALKEDCPNQRGLSHDEAFMDAIIGPKP